MSPLDLIPPQYRALAVAGVLVAAAGIGAAGGWAVNGWRLGTVVADTKREAAEERTQALRGTVAALKTTAAERDKLAGQLVDVDKTHTENLARLTNENETLRGRVAAGSRVVRVRGAVCPERTANMPAPSPGGGVDSGTGAVLAPAAGQDFFDLRRDAIRVGEKLAACQDAVKRMTGQ